MTDKTVKVHGVWNFRDNYVNGSDPDDYSSVSVKLGCSKVDNTTTITYNYKDEQTADSAYLYSSGLNGAPISGVRDRVSKFIMKTDHGYTDVTVTRAGVAGCAKHELGADYAFEHNQDGGSVASVTASFGILSVNYNSVSARMQKGTQPIYRSN